MKDLAYLLAFSVALFTSLPSVNAEDQSKAQVVKYSTCFRTKIASNSDDDGNTYFYNGAWRAQYRRYVSFVLCDVDNKGSYNCNDGTPYVLEMTEYLESAINYADSYCNACSGQCNRWLRRDEEDGNGEAQMSVNCNTCRKECSLLSGESENEDETQYVECQLTSEGDNLAIYSAPQCDKGQIVIGNYYDNECTIKVNSESNTHDAYGFGYSTFRTVEDMYMDCSNSDVCQQLVNEALSCAGQNSDSLCKAAEMAEKTYEYAKKPRKIPVKGLVTLLIVLSVVFVALSYVYFVRHNRPKLSLAQQDATPEVPPLA